jgi:hypothetical protein
MQGRTQHIRRLGVQIEYDMVHLRTSLVQLFALLQLNFEEVVQIIELSRFGGAPNGYPFAALTTTTESAVYVYEKSHYERLAPRVNDLCCVYKN